MQRIPARFSNFQFENPRFAEGKLVLSNRRFDKTTLLTGVRQSQGEKDAQRWSLLRQRSA